MNGQRLGSDAPPPMVSPRCMRALLLGSLVAVSFVLTACKSEPAPDPTHRYTTMLTVTDDGLLPEPTVTVPVFSTVVWRNRGSKPMAIEVEGAPYNECDTVLGFAAAGNGSRAAAIQPGEVATLCFHEAGTFPFKVRVDATERQGFVLVKAER